MRRQTECQTKAKQRTELLERMRELTPHCQPKLPARKRQNNNSRLKFINKLEKHYLYNKIIIYNLQGSYFFNKNLFTYYNYKHFNY